MFYPVANAVISVYASSPGVCTRNLTLCSQAQLPANLNNKNACLLVNCICLVFLKGRMPYRIFACDMIPASLHALA